MHCYSLLTVTRIEVPKNHLVHVVSVAVYLHPGQFELNTLEMNGQLVPMPTRRRPRLQTALLVTSSKYPDAQQPTPHDVSLIYT